MTVKVAINGFGRIGRNVLRAIVESGRKDIEAATAAQATELRKNLDGLLARCLQHEMDHLDGILYIDKVKNLRGVQTDEEIAEAEAVAAGTR